MGPGMRRKKFFVWFGGWVVLALLLTQGRGARAQQEFFPFVAEVVSDGVNLRAGQSANFEKICRLKAGQEVVVLGKSYSWYKVKLPATAKSYVSRRYVRKKEDGRGEITGNHVNIRAGAGIHFSVLGQLAKGEVVRIVEEQKDWVRIVPIQDSYGWIKENLLAFKSSDISSYQEPAIPALAVKEPKVETKNVAPVKKAPPLKETPSGPPVSEMVKVVEETPPPEAEISASGVMAATDHPGRFALVANGKPVYYLENVASLAKAFLSYRVTVTGRLRDESPAQTKVPVILPSRIELVL